MRACMSSCDTCMRAVTQVSQEPTMMSREARALMLSGQGQAGLEMWKVSQDAAVPFCPSAFPRGLPWSELLEACAFTCMLQLRYALLLAA